MQDLNEQMKAKGFILVDSSVGIYIPQNFAKRYADHWEGIKPEDLEILKAGPDHEDYDEAWSSVLETANYTDTDGTVLWLLQDEDLFAVELE